MRRRVNRTAGTTQLTAADAVLEKGKERLAALQKYLLENYELHERITEAFLNPANQPSTKQALRDSKITDTIPRVVQLPETPWRSRVYYWLDVFNSVSAVGSAGLSAARWAGFFGAASVLPTLLLTATSGYATGAGLVRIFAKMEDIQQAQWGSHPAGGSTLIKAASEFRTDLTAAEKAQLSSFQFDAAAKFANLGGKLLGETYGGRFLEAFSQFTKIAAVISPANYKSWRDWGATVLTTFLDYWIEQYVDKRFEKDVTYKAFKANAPTLRMFADWFGLPKLSTASLTPEKLQRYYTSVKNAAAVLRTLTLWVWHEISRSDIHARLGAGLHTNLTRDQQARRLRIRRLLHEASGLDTKKDEEKLNKWAAEIETATKEVEIETEEQKQVEHRTKELIPMLLSFWNSQVQDSQTQALFLTRYRETQKLLENYLGKDSSAHSPLTISRLAYALVEDLNLVPVEKSNLWSKFSRAFTIEKGLRYDRPKLLTVFGTGSSILTAPSFMLAVCRLAIYSKAVYTSDRKVLANSVNGNIAYDTTAAEYRANKFGTGYISKAKNFILDLSQGQTGAAETGTGTKSFEVAGYSNDYEPLLRYEDPENPEKSQATAKLLDFKPQTTGTTTVQYALIYDDVLRSLVVVIRGTQSLFDVFTDADMRLRLYKDGYIHNGFYEQAVYMTNEVRNWLRARTNVVENLRTILFTGHSLGAGVAGVCTLFALDSPDVLFGIRTLGVGFATPSTMTPNLGKRVCGYFHSFVLGQDVVPTASAYSIYRYGLRKNILLPCAHKAGNCDREDFLSDPLRDCQVFMPTVPTGSIQYCCWRLNGTVDPTKDVETVKFLSEVTPANVAEYITPEILTVHPAWTIDRLEIGPQSITDHFMDNYLHLLRTYYFDMQEAKQHAWELLNKSSVRTCLKNWRVEFMRCPAYPRDFNVPKDVANEVECALSLYHINFAGRRLTNTLPPPSAKAQFFVPKISCNPSGTQDTEQVCETYYSQEEEAKKLFEPGSMIPALAAKYLETVSAELMALSDNEVEGSNNNPPEKQRLMDSLKRRGYLAQAILDAYRQAYSAYLPTT